MEEFFANSFGLKNFPCSFFKISCLISYSSLTRATFSSNQKFYPKLIVTRSHTISRASRQLRFDWFISSLGGPVRVVALEDE